MGLRVVVSLAAVLGLLWYIQKRVSKSGRVVKGAKHVTVVARQGLAGKASVAVVDVEGVRYVLGVTEQQVTVLGSNPAPSFLTALDSARVDVLDDARAEARDAALDVAREGVDGPSYEPATAVRALLPVDSPRRAARAAAGRAAAGHAAAAPAPVASPMAGSILSASTWKQAAAAMRSQKRA